MTRRVDDILPDTMLTGLSKLVEAKFGLHFPPDRWLDLDRGIRAASLEWGAGDPAGFAERLVSSMAGRSELEALANHLTVGETHFFREKHGLKILEEQITGTTASRQLKIWSAGCATGEEPYSIAILLRRIIPDWSGWNISILATDLNARSLQKASDGVYGEWSFRGVPHWLRGKYFSETAKGQWAIDPSIKKMVRFTRWNLVDDGAPGMAEDLDVIFCCNVLMYLSPTAAQKVVSRLHRSLGPKGWLVVGPAEVSHTLFREFEPVACSGAMLYRKSAPQAVTWSGPVSPRPDEEEPEPRGTTIGIPPDDADRTPAMLRLARAYADRGRLAEAFRWCEKAIATGKADAPVHYLRAVILEEQGCFDEAARSLRRALFLDPRFAIGHFASGNLAIKRGRPQESEKHFENALAVLATCQPDDILPEAAGMTAGRLKELIPRRSDG